MQCASGHSLRPDIIKGTVVSFISLKTSFDGRSCIAPSINIYTLFQNGPQVVWSITTFGMKEKSVMSARRVVSLVVSSMLLSLRFRRPSLLVKTHRFRSTSIPRDPTPGKAPHSSCTSSVRGDHDPTNRRESNVAFSPCLMLRCFSPMKLGKYRHQWRKRLRSLLLSFVEDSPPGPHCNYSNCPPANALLSQEETIHVVLKSPPWQEWKESRDRRPQ